MSKSKEQDGLHPSEIPSLETLVGIQEQAAATVSTYAKTLTPGDKYLSGRRVKIQKDPNGFYLTFKDTDRSEITLSMQPVETIEHGIKSRYSLSYVVKVDDLSSRTVSYRFDQNTGVKTYLNGHASEVASEMQEEDFLKARNILGVIHSYFLELIPSL